MNFTRRRLTSLIGCAPALPLNLEPLHRSDSPAEALRNLLHHRGIARALGRSYLEQCPGESDPATLVRLIHGALYSASDVQTFPVATRMQTDLRTRLQAEFAAGNTVTVGGWMLARTEARLCALCR